MTLLGPGVIAADNANKKTDIMNCVVIGKYLSSSKLLDSLSLNHLPRVVYSLPLFKEKHS